MVKEEIDEINLSKNGHEFFFVYGTLMEGFGNNVLLSHKSEKETDGYTAKKYALYGNGIPFVNEYESVSPIQGEIWKVSDQDTIDAMDDLEGHPDWYYRRKIIVVGNNGALYNCWIYFNNFNNPNYLLEHGSYKKYYQEKKDNRRPLFLKD